MSWPFYPSTFCRTARPGAEFSSQHVCFTVNVWTQTFSREKWAHAELSSLPQDQHSPKPYPGGFICLCSASITKWYPSPLPPPQNCEFLFIYVTLDVMEKAFVKWLWIVVVQRQILWCKLLGNPSLWIKSHVVFRGNMPCCIKELIS